MTLVEADERALEAGLRHRHLYDSLATSMRLVLSSSSIADSRRLAVFSAWDSVEGQDGRWRLHCDVPKLCVLRSLTSIRHGLELQRLRSRFRDQRFISCAR